MTKRIITLLLCMLLISAVGCGKVEDNSASKNENVDDESVSVQEEDTPTSESTVTEIPLGEEVTVTINDSTHTLYVKDVSRSAEPSDHSAAGSITLDGTELSLEPYFYYTTSCYLIQQTGRTLLLVDGDIASSDYVTILYDISAGTLQELATTQAAIAVVDVDSVQLTFRIDGLGTYFASAPYSLALGEELTRTGSEFVINDVPSPLTTIKELPVTTEDGEELLLPPGTFLTPTATNINSYYKLTDTATSESYILYFTREDYQLMIQGINETEYFEALPYAG